MAAITLGSRVDTIQGNKRVAFGTLSAAGNNDTIATGFQTVDLVSITPTASGITWGATISGGTVTLKLSGATTGLIKIEGT